MADDNIRLDEGFKGGRTNPEESLDDMNFDEFDFDMGIEKDDRSPVDQAMSGAREGVWEMVEDDYVTQADRLTNITLPKSMNVEKEKLSDIMTEKEKEYSKVTNDLKGDAVTLGNAINSFLPEGRAKTLLSDMKDKIGWEDRSKKKKDGAEEAHDSDVANQLNEMFSKQMDSDNQRHLESDAKADVKDKIIESRDNITKELLLGIKDATAGNFKYTTEITAQYQRKSLELRFKQVFLAKESLKKSQGYYESSTKLLQAIGKNTALPEFVKIRGGEILHQQGIQKFTQSALSSVSGEDSYIQKKGRNFRDWGLSKLQKLQGVTSQGAMAADMASGMGDMVSTSSVAGEVAKKGVVLGAKWSKDKMAGRNGGDNGFNRFINKIYDKIADAPYAMEAAVNARNDAIKEREAQSYHGYDPYGEGDTSVHGDGAEKEKDGRSAFNPKKMFDTAKGAIGNGVIGKSKGWLFDKLAVNMYEAFNFDKKDHVLDLTKDAKYQFDKRFYTSVTDVIPGYLSRILQSVSGIQNGGEVDPLTYNHGTNEFINTDKMKGTLRDEVENNLAIDRYRIGVEKIIDTEFKDFVGDDETKRDRMREMFYKQAELNQKKGEGMKTYDDIIRGGALDKEADADLIELLQAKQAESRGRSWDKGKFTSIEELEKVIPNVKGLAEAFHASYGKTGLEGAGVFDINGNNVTIAEGSVVEILKQRAAGEISGEHELAYLIETVKASAEELERAQLALDSKNPIEVAEWIQYLKAVLYGDPVEMPSDSRDGTGDDFVGPADGRNFSRRFKDAASGLATKWGLGDKATTAKGKVQESKVTRWATEKANDLDEKWGISAKARAFENEYGYGGKIRVYKDSLMEKIPDLTAEEAEDLVMNAIDRYGDNPELIVETITNAGQGLSDLRTSKGIAGLFDRVKGGIAGAAGGVTQHSKDVLEVARGGDGAEEAKARILDKHGDNEQIVEAINKLENTLKNVHGIADNEKVEVDPNDPMKGMSFPKRLASSIGGLFKKKKPKYNDVDGDGDRDGSWRDLFSRRKNGEDGNPLTMKDRARKAGKMGLGALGGAAGFAGNMMSGLLGKIFGGIPGGGLMLGALGGATRFGGKAALGLGKMGAKLGKKALIAVARRIGPRLLPLWPVGTLIGGALLLFSVFDDIKDFFSGGITGMVEKTDQALTDGVKGIDKLIDKFKWSVMDGLKDIKDGVTSTLGDIKDGAAWLGEEIGSEIYNGVQATKEWWSSDSSLLDDVQNLSKKAVNATVQAGKDAVKATTDYINNGESFLEKVTNLATAVIPGMAIYADMQERRREGQDASTFLRMLQYGIPLESQSPVLVERIKHAERILLVNGGLKRSGGKWKFFPSLLLLDGVWQVLNMGEYTDEKETILAQWVALRFVPVLIAHLDAKTSTDLKPGFTKAHPVADGMHRPYLETMLEYMAATPGAYKIGTNPFSHRGIDALVTDADAINQFAEKTINSYSDENPNTPDPQSKGVLNKIIKDAHASTLTPDQKKQMSAKVVKAESTQGESEMVKAPVTPPKLASKVSALRSKLNKDRLKPIGTMESLDVRSSELSMSRLNPKVRQALLEMGADYEAITGKKLQINAGWRSGADQQLVRDKFKDKAAKSLSMHQLGFAIDIPQTQVDKLMNFGLLNEYGFNRPLDSGGERHHIEPTVLQGNKKAFERNPEFMSHAFDHGRGVVSYGLGEGTEMHYKADGTLDIRRDSKAAVPMEKLWSPVPERAPRSNGISTMKGAVGDGDVKATTTGPKKPVGNSDILRGPNAAGGSNGRTQDREVLDIIDKAAKTYGVDPDTLRVIMAQESSLNPLIKNDGSSATGLGQATTDMWTDWQNYRDSKKHPDDRKDPMANAMASAWYISNYSRSIRKEMPNFKDNPVYSYLITLLGSGNGPAFIRRLQKTPDALVSTLLKSSVITGNKDYFAPNGKIVTFQQAFNIIQSHLKDTAKDFSLNFRTGSSSTAAVLAAAAQTTVSRSDNDAPVDSIEPRSASKARELAAVAPSRSPSPSSQPVIVQSPSEVKINSDAFNLVEEEARKTSDNTSRTNELLQQLIVKLDANAKAESREVVKPKAPPAAQAFNVRNPA